MNNLHLNIYLSVGIVLAFAFNSRRELLGGLSASPDDDGSESLFWFSACAFMWPLMLASVVYARMKKSRQKQH